MLVKVAHLGDTHIVKGVRWDELCRIHDWIADDLERRKPDLITHGGDVFHRETIPEERNRAHDLIIRLARIAPVFIVRGNHDQVGEIEVFRKLRSKYPIYVEEEIGVKETDKVIVAGFAWPRKAELLARLDGSVSLQATDETSRVAMQQILRGLGAEIDLRFHDSPKPRILVMHAMVRGSITSTGQPLVGCDFEASLEDLHLAGCDFACLSHIHKGQEMRIHNMPVVYPGSTYRTAYGELETKGYLWIEFTDRKPSFGHVDVPATPMLLLEGVFSLESNAITFEDKYYHQLEKVNGADVRIRYKVEGEHRDVAEQRANDLKRTLLAEGAIKVALEEVQIARVRARVPEIATAVSTTDKWKVYCRAKNNVPDPQLEAALLTKLEVLEHEVMEA